MINKPYIKKYDAKGQLINPLKGSTMNVFPNRRTRKKLLKNAAKKQLENSRRRK